MWEILKKMCFFSSVILMKIVILGAKFAKFPTENLWREKTLFPPLMPSIFACFEVHDNVHLVLLYNG